MPSLEPYMSFIVIGEKRQIHLDSGNANYPTLLFMIQIDSKVNFQLEIDEILARVYMGSCYMDSIRWNHLDKEWDNFGVIEKLGNTWINFNYTPPKDFLNSYSPTLWKLQGTIYFSADNYIPYNKKFSLDFKLKDEEIKVAIDRYFT